MKRAVNIVSWWVIVAIGSAGVMLLSKLERTSQLDEGIMALKIDDGPTALRKLKPLAETGNKTAQGLLGEAYTIGVIPGIPKNDELAIRWFRAEASGNRDLGPGQDPAADAEYQAGKNYLDGTYGKDPVEARKWLRLAAKGGSREAAAMLKDLEK